jgi:hypothetical protein
VQREAEIDDWTERRTAAIGKDNQHHEHGKAAAEQELEDEIGPDREQAQRWLERLPLPPEGPTTTEVDR